MSGRKLLNDGLIEMEKSRRMLGSVTQKGLIMDMMEPGRRIRQRHENRTLRQADVPDALQVSFQAVLETGETRLRIFAVGDSPAERGGRAGRFS